MNNRSFVAVLRHIHRLSEHGPTAENSDRQLLGRFLGNQDQAAFAAIVQRHGDMIWGVCRRILSDPNDAKDAFQASFLVLLNKASSLQERESLAGWLQGVAWRLSRKAKAQAIHRKAKEAVATSSIETLDDNKVIWNDLRIVLDEELSGLPEKYRLPLILCYLEGKTYSEAAIQLGWSNGTVCGRLARARDLLKRRLTSRGIAISAATLTATSLEPLATPAAVIASVSSMARAFLLCHSMRDAASTRALVLARGLLQTMALGKLKVASLAIGLAFVCASSAALVSQQIQSEQAGAVRTRPTETYAQVEQKSPDSIAVSTEQEISKATPDLRKDFYGDPLPKGVLARMGSVQLRHPQAEIAFSSEGKSLVSFGADLAVIQWDVYSGKMLRKSVFQLATKGVQKLAPDGNTFAVGTSDLVQLYDVTTGIELRRFKFPGGPGNALGFSGNGKFLACASASTPECELKVWDVATGEEKLSLKTDLGGRTATMLVPDGAGFRQKTIKLNPNHHIRSVLFSADGSVIGLKYGRMLMLWDSASGQVLGKDIETAEACALSPDGKILARANDSGATTLFQIPSMERLAVLDPHFPLPRHSVFQPRVAYSSDGAFVTMGGLEQVVIWDARAFKEIGRLDQGHAQQIAFAPSGRTLAVAGKSIFRLWDLPTCKELHPRKNHDDRIHLGVSPDGKVVVSTEIFSSQVAFWDTRSGKPLHSIADGRTGDQVCNFTSDGRILLCGEFGGNLNLLDFPSGEAVHKFVEIDASTGRPARQNLTTHLSSDGKRLNVITRAFDPKNQEQRHQVSVLDVATGKPLVRRVFPGTGFLTFGAFTSSGQRMAVCADGRMSIQETLTGAEILNIAGEVGYPIQFSPSSDFAVIGMQKTDIKNGPGQLPSWKELGLRIIEVTTGEELFRIVGPNRTAAFSSDSRTLATVNADCLQLWDVVTGKELYRIQWPPEFVPEDKRLGVSSLALMPDGQAAVVGMPDGTILVWDLRSAAKPKSWKSDRALASADFEKLWIDLAGEPKQAQAAIHSLAEVAEKAVPFLTDRLAPVQAADPIQTRKLIADLDSQDAGIRNASAVALVDLGERIAPELRGVLDASPSMEARASIDLILLGWKSTLRGETRRTARAVQALRMIGSPQALQTLQKIASGAPEARETRMAKYALEELKGGGMKLERR